MSNIFAINLQHIEQQVSTLLRKATTGTYLCVPCFPNGGINKDARVVRQWAKVTPDRKEVIQVIREQIDYAYRHNMVCAPIWCSTFKDTTKQAEINVADVLSIAIDFDKGNPIARIREAAFYLCSPTYIMVSGGRTEKDKDKLHAYWVLPEPIERNSERYSDLVAVHKHITKMVGGDPTSSNVVHALRAAGSMNTKRGVNRMARMADLPELFSTELFLDWEMVEERALQIAQQKENENYQLITLPKNIELLLKAYPNTYIPKLDDKYDPSQSDLDGATYERYIRIGMAIADAYGEDGRQVFHDWCEQSEKYSETKTDGDFDTWVANKYAGKESPLSFRSIELELREAKQIPIEYYFTEDVPPPIQDRSYLTEDEDERLFPFKPTSFFLSGLIPKPFEHEARIGVLSGPSFVGKSILAVTLGCMIAAGKALPGFTVSEQTGVAYFALEDYMGAKNARNMCRYLLDTPIPEFALTPPADLDFTTLTEQGLRKHAGRFNLWKRKRRIKRIGVLFLDTTLYFAKLIQENDAAAVAEFYTNIRFFAKLIGNPTIIIIHHPPKAGKSGEGEVRGSGALVNAADFHLELFLEPEPPKLDTKLQGYSNLELSRQPLAPDLIEQLDNGNLAKLPYVTTLRVHKMKGSGNFKRDQYIQPVLLKPDGFISNTGERETIRGIAGIVEDDPAFTRLEIEDMQQKAVQQFTDLTQPVRGKPPIRRSVQVQKLEDYLLILKEQGKPRPNPRDLAAKFKINIVQVYRAMKPIFPPDYDVESMLS